MPIAQDDRRLDQARFLALYLRLAQVQLGTLCNSYEYHSVKRMVDVEGDDIEAAGDDPLAARLVDGIKALPASDGAREVIIDPPASVAALFQAHELARALKPKLFVGFDLRDASAVCGMLACCTFARDDALSTARLTQGYCGKHALPRFDANWMLVDVVTSNKAGTGALLLLSAVVHAARAKKAGVLSIAVTRGGLRLFESFGFDCSHAYREGGSQRHLCHARLSDLHLADAHKRLRVHPALLTDVCVRNGLTARTMHNVVGRC